MTREEFAKKWGRQIVDGWEEDYSADVLADLDSLSLPPAEGAEKPYMCPVCCGNGLVPNGFYNTFSGIGSTISTTPETCRSCNGAGIIFASQQQPTDEGAEIDDMMFTISEDGINPLDEQPTAEGAEDTREIVDNLIKRHVPIDAANLEYCIKHNIINGSLLQGIRDVVREFATLHAQQIADKMVSERLREELINFLKWDGITDKIAREFVVGKYLNNVKK